MDGKQFHWRVRSIVGVLLILILLFAWVLYDLQYVHGADYLAQSRRKIAKTETVEAARGEILDRYGRVLVTNRESYNVSLDTSFMEDVNTTLTKLLDICRTQGVTWADTLPISAETPFVFTFDTASSGAISNLYALAESLKWTDTLPAREEADAIRTAAQEGQGVSYPSADAFLDKLREYYEIDPLLPDGEARALLGVRYELTLRSREITYTAYVFAQDVQMPFIVTVKEADLPGVNIDTTTVREYNTAYAAHLLGRVGLMNSDEWNNVYQALNYPYNATVGKEGVELAFESYLHGTPGKRNIETNDQGKVVSGDDNWVVNQTTGEVQAPDPGDNVILTLDIKLQEAVERALATGIGGLKSEDTQGGAAVVIDVRDGGVLAMASYPTFDLTTYTQNYNALLADPLNPLLNRATQEVYPPGSTFKMVTAIGALEEGIIEPDTEILDTGRYLYYDDYRPQCWIYRDSGGRSTHGSENVSGAIKDSCNVFFFDVGRRLGISLLEQYAAMFGLGEPTGIELYEATGWMDGPEYTESQGQTWYEGNTLPAAIGQGNSRFTPLQLANYVATLANGGTHYSAHLLKEVKSNDFSQVVEQYEPTVLNQLDIDPENLAAVTEGMLRVTAEGSAKAYFADLGVQVAAKTGSAQVSSATESNALFVAFAPYENPEIALAIVVEKGGSGSTLANIAAEILEYYFSAGSGMETVTPENTLLR
ncbi:penicillin-binding transpeptidase domain-containing protein [uncultured Intestinimonas sp.]|uniref:penicillin-binding transpeptidase domain-containing protein n=1 Tax=uncultured Intestinimonas sp. TaxID=1689265 RepID=UPI0025D28851|nr:penicillin-binding transpeptidase domain-containing protein [uncultured Intestinimonas sp.]